MQGIPETRKESACSSLKDQIDDVLSNYSHGNKRVSGESNITEPMEIDSEGKKHILMETEGER